MPSFQEAHQAAFPQLTPANYRETSSATWTYNCIAWAAGDSDHWWWPITGRHWPPGVPREETMAAFLTAFATIGYIPIHATENPEGEDRVALYARAGVPTHAARQLPGGTWTSKRGRDIDIEHDTLDAIAGGIYGQPVAVLIRIARENA